MTEKPYLVSGRNTLIHKVRKFDLLVVNGDDNPPVIVTCLLYTSPSPRD